MSETREQKIRKWKKIEIRRKEQRKDPSKRWIFVLKSIKSNDKVRGFVCTLMGEEVERLLKLPCSYCGDSDSKMSLDRINNERGHSIDNILPSCLRCNRIRRDMPFDAWLVIADAVRMAREKGLFVDWKG